MPPPQVLVVGSINVDLTMRVGALPRPGETVLGGRFARGGGGKGANAAVAAARVGAATVFVGAVGEDDDGARERAALAAAGIDVRWVAVVAGVATGVAMVTVADGGDNQIAVASGANEHVDPAAATAAVAALDAPRAAVLLGFEVPDAPLIAAAHAAAERAIPIVLNPAPARPLAPGLVACGPILTPNEGEVVALAGGAEEVEDAARALARRTRAPVVVTLGARGALVVTPDGVTDHLPAPTVAAVDATGAGDTFSGVLAASLAARRPLLDAVTDAIAAAARSVTAPGAR